MQHVTQIYLDLVLPGLGPVDTYFIAKFLNHLESALYLDCQIQSVVNKCGAVYLKCT